MQTAPEKNQASERFGEFLLREKEVTSVQLELALKIQRRIGVKRIGELLVDLGFLDETKLREALSRFLQQKPPDLKSLRFDESFYLTESVHNPNVIRLISDDGDTSVLLTPSLETSVTLLARKYRTADGRDSTVLTMAPSEIFSIFSEKSRSFFERRFYDETVSFLRGSSTPASFLEALLSYAAVLDASDVHFDVEPQICRIRIRSEGVLRPVLIMPHKDYQVLVNYIKEVSEVPANVNVRKPIDASFNFKKGLINLDIRVSIVPTAKVEEVGVGTTVLRLFSKTAKRADLDSLGFSDVQVRLIREWFQSQSGLILITGPTGSGKSTTTRAALSEVIKPEINIMSVEDPVEQLVNLLKQVEAKEGILSFEEVLQAMLRHDPDIIFVGEIRSKEVAKICLHAALTGHLVIATLHASNSFTVVPRLLELGVDRQILMNTLRGVISQRLVRRVCQKCKTLMSVDPLYEKWSRLAKIEKEYKGRGCPECYYEGFRGRTVIAEVIPIRDVGPHLFLDLEKVEEAKKRIKEMDIPLIFDHGVDKVVRGETTLEEVVRVI